MLKGKNKLVRMVVLALTVPLAVALLASPAFAKGTPTKGYKNFTLCPLKNLNVEECLWSGTNKGSTGGEVVLNKQKVPIEVPVELQGGIYYNETTKKGEFVNAEGGPTLSNSPQNVPGGLLGILPPEFLPEPLKFLFEEYIINKGPTGVTVTTELVGAVHINEGALINGANEAAVTLPVRAHLNNTFLGSECYIGSAAHPLTLELTTGTTKPPVGVTPITGKVGTIISSEEDNLLTITENSLVENNFSAPGAEKCVNYIPTILLGRIIEKLANEVIDGKIGLPSGAGKNVAILNGTIQRGGAEAVKNSE